MHDIRFKLIGFAIFALTIAASAWGQEEERPLWEQEAMLIYSDSSSEFTRLRTLGRENQRLAMYTRALEILHERVEADSGDPQGEAKRLFTTLVADDLEDAIHLASLYYLAGIEQERLREVSPDEGKRLYFELFEAHGDGFFGQMALIKYATLEIYDVDVAPNTALERLQELEKLVDKATLPATKRNFHRILGEAYLRFDLNHRRAFEHLEVADEIGIPAQSLRIEVLIKLAGLGETLGESERALTAYDELLLLAPTHERASEFRQKARQLRKAVNSAASN